MAILTNINNALKRFNKDCKDLSNFINYELNHMETNKKKQIKKITLVVLSFLTLVVAIIIWKKIEPLKKFASALNSLKKGIFGTAKTKILKKSKEEILELVQNRAKLQTESLARLIKHHVNKVQEFDRNIAETRVKAHTLFPGEPHSFVPSNDYLEPKPFEVGIVKNMVQNVGDMTVKLFENNPQSLKETITLVKESVPEVLDAPTIISIDETPDVLLNYLNRGQDITGVEIGCGAEIGQKRSKLEEVLSYIPVIMKQQFSSQPIINKIQTIATAYGFSPETFLILSNLIPKQLKPTIARTILTRTPNTRRKPNMFKPIKLTLPNVLGHFLGNFGGWSF